jgi:hypothetical protein
MLSGCVQNNKFTDLQFIARQDVFEIVYAYGVLSEISNSSKICKIGPLRNKNGTFFWYQIANGLLCKIS